MKTKLILNIIFWVIFILFNVVMVSTIILTREYWMIIIAVLFNSFLTGLFVIHKIEGNL